MATTTPNFGWSVPTSTDLVKDGATAIETLGDSIDASLVDLKGGTTGQVLAKASGTDMDFTWATDASGIPATIFDAKGDIIAASAADTAARLAVGANDTVLTADSSTATGLKWAAAGGGLTWTLLNTGGTALTGASSITISGISNQKQLVVLVDGASSASASAAIRIRPNNLATGIYNSYGASIAPASTVAPANFTSMSGLDSLLILADMSATATSTVSGGVKIESANTSGFKFYESFGSGTASGSNTQTQKTHLGFIEMTTAITSIVILTSAGNFDAGTIYVYGGV